MRVVVNIPPGSHPELLKELEKTPPRERAERLRMLATFGLIHMSQPNLSTTSAPVDGHAPDGDVTSMSTAPEPKAESCQRQFNFDPFCGEFGNLFLTPPDLNFTECRCDTYFLFVFQPVALATDLYHVAVMQQTI